MTGEGPQRIPVTRNDGADERSAPPVPESGETSPVEAPQDAAGPGPDLEMVQRERDDFLDSLQRLKADFDNYRKRMERERVQTRASAVREVLVQVLPVLDNMERAVDALGTQDAALVEGVAMVRGQLAAVLSGQGLVEVAALGEAFDPLLHEAVAMVPSPDHAAGVVIEVIQKGYRAGDELVRAAKVIVAAG